MRRPGYAVWEAVAESAPSTSRTPRDRPDQVVGGRWRRRLRRGVHDREPEVRWRCWCRRDDRAVDPHRSSASRRSLTRSSLIAVPERGTSKRPSRSSSSSPASGSTRRPEPSTVMSTTPGRRPLRSRRGLGMTSRPAESMVAFMAIIYHHRWLRHGINTGVVEVLVLAEQPQEVVLVASRDLATVGDDVVDLQVGQDAVARTTTEIATKPRSEDPGSRADQVARGGGLEPPMTGPEPVVLPITPPPKAEATGYRPVGRARTSFRGRSEVIPRSSGAVSQTSSGSRCW